MMHLHTDHHSLHANIIWTEEVWANAESKWLARNGQDAYYRNHVVIPAIVRSIQGHITNSQYELVDIGCGDGYCTDHLISVLRQIDLSPKRILLVDRSDHQLEVAGRRQNLKIATKLKVDINRQDWFHQISTPTIPRIVICIFVTQELPELQPLFSGISSITSNFDAAYFITVAPSFSDHLKKQHAILDIVEGTTSNDWQWRGLYPIDGAAGRLYLPHFQRTIHDYKNTLLDSGFSQHFGVHYLSVPNSESAESVFSETVYKQDIIDTPSSVILSCVKVNKH